MNEHHEVRYVLGLILATQEYLRDTDPTAATGIAAYLRAIAKNERNADGDAELAERFDARAGELEEED
jgi:hypothetical protein